MRLPWLKAGSMASRLQATCSTTITSAAMSAALLNGSLWLWRARLQLSETPVSGLR